MQPVAATSSASSPSAPRTVALVAVAAVLLCGLAAGAGAWRLHHRDPQASALRLDEYVTRGWVAWDAGWYMQIAEFGYQHYTPGQQSPVAFFPLYALAVRGVKALAGLDVQQAGVLVTALCGPLALLLFALWARTRAPERDALTAGLFLAVYPFSFYLYGAMYSDALFVMLVVAAFLLLERGWLLPAVLVAAVATAARPVAPAVVFGLLVRRLEWKRERGLRWGLVDLLPVLAALGFGLYCVYLWQRFGEPFAFVKVQGAPGWEQTPGWRTWLKLVWFKAVFLDPTVSWKETLRLCTHAGLTLAALALVWPTARRLGWGYAAYTAAIVGMPALSTKDFMGMGRYLLSAFPLFLTLALLLRDWPRLRTAGIALGAVVLVVLSAAFGMEQYLS